MRISERTAERWFYTLSYIFKQRNPVFSVVALGGLDEESDADLICFIHRGWVIQIDGKGYSATPKAKPVIRRGIIAFAREINRTDA